MKGSNKKKKEVTNERIKKKLRMKGEKKEVTNELIKNKRCYE